ncbi:MAG: hypothetical protein JWQ97_2043, partial [Phenylobacterium sp.]|nr:hypothetical protein [Phenylobacterium sp.]
PAFGRAKATPIAASKGGAAKHQTFSRA